MFVRACLCLLMMLLLAGCATYDSINRPVITDQQAFMTLMQDLATAWNAGDAGRAAGCFTEDAVYSQPPAQQLYRGRENLFDFFGGDEGRPGQMHMEWHHLSFNEAEQIGFGEFSFTYGTSAHGVAIVRIRQGRIANWREYWYESVLPWHEFTRENRF